ncbi:hypothetical protein [Anatilimnocola floriformis]|uniref:hypothetical protein n=1 Tax=Anatilimnocola floriformis TaxID=2948575 RepID=UPI0020C50C9A|nr:hypothetical protein [Anatilimnocola floriformis]
MKTLPWFAIIVTFAVLRAATVTAAEPQGRLLFLGVAYDEGPPKGQTADHFNYAPDNFTRLLQAQAKGQFQELKFDTLKGGAATRISVAAKLRGLKQIARKEDLVFVYWGTHGGSDKQGWSANLPGDGQILGSEIKDALRLLPCPALVAISTCGSGGFIRHPGQGVDLPANVVALCACRRKQTTNNELDVSLLEALAGFGDANDDGQVTLQEALDYVPARYTRITRDTESADLQPVVGHGERAVLDRVLTKTNDSHVAVVYENKWYGATILERHDGKVKVRYLGYDYANRKGGFHFADEMVPLERVDFPGDYPPIEVEWNGAWYAAKVLNRAERGFRIHYVGYPASDDEDVLPRRIRFPFVGGVEQIRSARPKAK